MSDWQWQLGIWGGGTTAGLLGAAFVVLWILEVRSIRGEGSRARRITLIALGALGMFAVYLIALQVTLVRETFEEVTGRTALLVDSSRSMTLAGTDGERRDQVRALLRKWGEESDVDPIVYLFGSSVRGAPWQSLPGDYDPTDDDTKLREGLRHLLQRGTDEGLGAVVVVTDGGDPSFRAGAFAEQPGTPAVHAVVVGGDDPLADEAIVSVRSDPTTYVGVPASIRARVRSVGRSVEGPMRVQLWREDRLIEEREVPLDADGRGEVAFEVTPRRPGRALYRLSIPLEDGDAVPENNDRTILLRVGRDRFRVLLVAGHPTWDVRFLREFLKRDASIDLVSFFILRTTSDLTAAPASELALIPFPTDELFREHLGSFDVIIFQNFDYAPYEMEPYLSRIRDYVLRGGSFAMIGGDRSFSAGGYAGTPIQEVLPVKLPTAPNAKTELQERFRVEPTPNLARHPIVALGPEPAITRRMWKELAPVHGANVVRGPRGAGQTLLQRDVGRRGASRNEAPILVVGQAGEGRVLALMTDSSWRWRFGGKDAAVGSDEYELFWDRALRWLSHDPLLEPARIGTDRERYTGGGDVHITGRLRDRQYTPLSEAQVELKVEADDEVEGETVSATTDAKGGLRAKLKAPTAPGAYEVVASVGDEELAREAFVVEQNSDELADLEVAPEELASLAKKTGGRAFLSVDETPPLDELLATTRKAVGLVARQPLSNPAFLAFTVMLLGLTWFLRRRWGRR